MASNIIRTEHVVEVVFHFGTYLGAALIEAHHKAEMYDKPVRFRFNEESYLISPTDSVTVESSLETGNSVYVYSMLGVLQYSTVRPHGKNDRNILTRHFSDRKL